MSDSLHRGPVFRDLGEYTLISCETCGFIHVDPLPPPATLEELYNHQFYDADKPDYLVKLECEAQYWRESVYEYRFEVFDRLLASREQSSPYRILDVGCSGGFFLKYAQELGWKVLGIEPSTQAAQFARDFNGVEVVQDLFQNVDFTARFGGFDVVHLRNVLEHLPTPIELCQKAYDALAPGGVLCLEVPNDFSPLQRLLSEQMGYPEYWVSVPHHLNYFTRDAIHKLLARMGFSIVHEDCSFPMEWFLMMGENYIETPSLGPQCHERRMAFETAWNKSPEARQLRQAFYPELAKLGMGRTLVVFAQKNQSEIS